MVVIEGGDDLRGAAVAAGRTRAAGAGVWRAAAGMVRAVGHVLGIRTSIGTTAHGFPAAGIVRGGSRAGYTVFGSGHRWHHWHHGHLHTAQFLDQIVDEEAQNQFNSDFRQDQSLESFKSNQRH